LEHGQTEISSVKRQESRQRAMIGRPFGGRIACSSRAWGTDWRECFENCPGSSRSQLPAAGIVGHIVRTAENQVGNSRPPRLSGPLRSVRPAPTWRILAARGSSKPHGQGRGSRRREASAGQGREFETGKSAQRRARIRLAKTVLGKVVAAAMLQEVPRGLHHVSVALHHLVGDATGTAEGIKPSLSRLQYEAPRSADC
jgi:hypothetical protein